jgi:NAD-dependent protein deacetylase/lipoamidase
MDRREEFDVVPDEFPLDQRTDAIEGFARLVNLIAASHRILVVTGAGISTEAGIPDYRGPNGVWRTQRPVEFDEFVHSEQRRTDYWEQKLASARVFADARPGSVHRSCVTLERAGRLEAIVTQNVDGLHREAGSSERVIVEVHGTAKEAACLSCGARGPIGPIIEEFAATRVPPRCSVCDGLLKPATISFGQQLDALTISRASLAADRCDIVIALGTTLSVHPAAAIPLRAARRGVPYVIVNRGLTDHDRLGSVTLRIEGEVGEVFAAAVSEALDRSSDDPTGIH